MRYALVILCLLCWGSILGCKESVGGLDSLSKNSTSDAPFVGTIWQLSSFSDSKGQSSDAGTVALSVVFKPDSTVEGRGRNLFFGSYSLGTGSRLTVDCHATTYAGILPGSKYLELLKAINLAEAYHLGEGRLRIDYGDGRALNFVVLADE